MTLHDILLFGISSLVGLVIGYVAGRIAARRIGGAGGTGGIGGVGGPGGGTGGQGGVGGQGGSPDKSGKPGGIGEGGGMPGTSGSEPIARKGYMRYLPAVVGVAILILLVTSVAMWSNMVSCQTQQNNEFREALAARGAMAKGQNAAMRKLIQTSADPKATIEIKKNAVEDYLDALDDLDRAQQANPLVATSCD